MTKNKLKPGALYQPQYNIWGFDFTTLTVPDELIGLSQENVLIYLKPIVDHKRFCNGDLFFSVELRKNIFIGNLSPTALALFINEESILSTP